MNANRHVLIHAFITVGALALDGRPADAQQLAGRKPLTLEGAKAVAAAALAQATRMSSSGVIAVVDGGGNLMSL